MQKQDQNMGDTKMLTKILNYKDNPQTVEQQAIKFLLTRSYDKVQQEIVHGDINVFDPNTIIEEIQRLRSQRLKKEGELLKVDINTQQQKFKSLKRQIIKLKKQQTELAKKQAKIKSKTIIEKVKKWQQIQQQIKKNKLQEEQAKRKEFNQEELKRKKEEVRVERAKREQKKRQIVQKLKKIEEYRLKRQQIIKMSSQEYAKLSPKYIQIQKKFKQLEQQVKFQKELYKKNHKITMKIDHQAIKSHQVNYMTHVKEITEKRKPLKSIDDDFTLFIYRNEDKIREEKQKLKRRREFQEILKHIPISVDEQKKMKMQIARDRGKNPLKYHFLSQKALDEQKIYEEFPNFQINTNPRQLGKEYLKQLPNLVQNSRITKSQSVSNLTQNSGQKNRYKDYLQDLKQQRPQRNKVTQEQLVSQHLSSNESKSKLLQKLDERAKKYQLQLRNRKKQLQGYNQFKSSIKKAKEIDQVYVKSIKAKLACLEMKE